jgi:hypothetical protein
MRHLDTNDLITYAEQRASSEFKQAIEEHVGICRRCAGEAARWIELLELLKTPDLKSAPKAAVQNCIAMYGIPQRANFFRQVFAKLMFDSAAEPELVGIRGTAESQHVLLQTDEVEVYLRISGTPRNILGQLLRSNGDFVNGARLELIRFTEPIDVTVSDTLGEFRFNTVPDGDLRLQAQIASDYQLIADFAIGGQGKN